MTTRRQPTPAHPLFKGHVKRGTESGYMLYQDLAVTAGADLPQLRLDLHVYAAKPQDRFALINMRKMHEGDSPAGRRPGGSHHARRRRDVTQRHEVPAAARVRPAWPVIRQ